MSEETYCIRVSQGNTTVEVSGDEKFVEKQFEDLREEYLDTQTESGAPSPEDLTSSQQKQVALGELYATSNLSYKRDAALLVGWFLESVEGQEDFTKSEVEDRAQKAKVELGKNLSRDLSTLVEKGLLREVGRRMGEKSYYLTRTGESRIHDEFGVDEASYNHKNTN